MSSYEKSAARRMMAENPGMNYTTALRAVREARSPASFVAGSPGWDKSLALRENLLHAAHEGRPVIVLDPKRDEERDGRREVIVEPFRSGYRFQVGFWEGGRPRPRQEGVLMFDEAYVMVSSERDLRVRKAVFDLARNRRFPAAHVLVGSRPVTGMPESPLSSGRFDRVTVGSLTRKDLLEIDTSCSFETWLAVIPMESGPGLMSNDEILASLRRAGVAPLD